MFNFKKSLDRRTFLRGAGVSVALPFLTAMVPSLTAFAQTAANRPRRVGFVYVPNGMVMTDKVDLWTPTKVGTDFEITHTLSPLSKYKSKLTVVSNLLGADGSGQHTGAATAWLTDMYPKKTQGTDVAAGISLDQAIARKIGGSTVFPSMELAIEDVTNLVGSCDAGFSCSYLNTISWASTTNPLPMQVNPRVVFERMFGGTGTPEQRRERLSDNRSILDSVLSETRSIEARVGPQDKSRLSDYLENVREVERRIQRAESRSGDLAASPESPSGIPESFPEHVGLMLDLLHVAYQTDLTRVASFMMARELSSVAYPQIGVRAQHHGISHHQNNPEFMEQKGKIDQYHVMLFSQFVDKLAATPDGDGSLLDHTMLVYGAGMSNSNEHVKQRLPYAIVSGFLKGNQHIKGDKHRPVGDLHIDIARHMGVELTSFGRSEGGTVGLT
ncbi:MAG: DUF1552 domain-containing protein [Steroidobacteraceae bacterium]